MGLFWEPEGNGTLGTATHRWEDIIKMHLKEIGLLGRELNYSGLGYDEVTLSCERNNETSCSVPHVEFLD
jgi:hypothetical protein